jgi:hypothetical protein
VGALPPGGLETACDYLGCDHRAREVIDALKEVFPITKNHRAASEYVNQVESLFIDSQLEWENILMAVMRMTKSTAAREN